MTRVLTRPLTPPATAGEIFALIRDGVVDTRSDVMRVTGLSRTAVTTRLAALFASRLVVEDDDGPSTGGRPPSRLRFDTRAGVVLAAAVGRSRTQLAVCDLGGEVLAAEDVDQEPGVAPGDLLPEVAKRLGRLLEQAGRERSEVRGIGASIPGTVDFDRGASLDSPLMVGWDGVPLAPYLRDGLDVPVFVDNDVNVMALSERSGHLERHRDVLFVKASTGLGAGIVAGGVLQRGALGAAGELGHTKTPAAADLECRCGDTGCLEAVAGGWALVRDLREQGREVGHVRHLVDLAVSGDAEARRLIRESGRRTGEVLAGAVNLLNPEAVVIGGDMARSYDSFVAGLRETLYGAATALSTRELVILPTTHGERSGVVGCASIVLEQVLSVDAVNRVVQA
jgi:predicted NBD/HSP70 family sugar kinase